MARGLFALATEDMEVDPVDEVVVDDAAVTDTIELNSDAAGITELSDSISEASAATDEITEIQDVAQKSIESGEGLPEAAVEMMMVSLKSINRRLGIKGDRSVFVVPATENFGTTKSRLAATNAVLEEAEKGKETIIETLKRWAKQLWKMVSDFFAKIFGRDNKNVEVAEAAVKAAEAAESTKEAGGADVTQAEKDLEEHTVKTSQETQAAIDELDKVFDGLMDGSLELVKKPPKEDDVDNYRRLIAERMETVKKIKEKYIDAPLLEAPIATPDTKKKKSPKAAKAVANTAKTVQMSNKKMRESVNKFNAEIEAGLMKNLGATKELTSEAKAAVKDTQTLAGAINSVITSMASKSTSAVTTLLHAA